MDINNLMSNLPKNEALTKAWFPVPHDETLESKIVNSNDWAAIKETIARKLAEKK